jgi:hypothetical protein
MKYWLNFICLFYCLSDCSADSVTNSQESKIIVSDRKDYQRDPIHTFLSSPEWQNVIAANEYAKFIRHTPFYEFPYMKSVASYWSVFFNSWNAAREKHSFWTVLSSDYTLMNVFVGVFMTVEYSLKALISLPIRLLMQGDEPRTIQLIVEGDEQTLKTLHPKLVLVEEIQNTNLKRVEVPRYDELKDIFQNLPSYPDLTIKEIAGNQDIQLTLDVPNTFSLENFSNTGMTKLYEWSMPTRQDQKFLVVLAQSKYLPSIVEFIKKHSLKIEVIHDF